jgi:hypothetical protein
MEKQQRGVVYYRISALATRPEKLFSGTSVIMTGAASQKAAAARMRRR